MVCLYEHSCSVRALLSPWERDAEYTQKHPRKALISTEHFSPTMVFKSAVQAAALSGWTRLNLDQDPLFLICLLSCTDAFQRQTLILESGKGHSRVGPSQAQAGFALGLFGEEWRFHIGWAFWPSYCSSSWSLLQEWTVSLFNGCTASSPHAERADRNSWVSFFAFCFNFTMVPELETQTCPLNILVTEQSQCWRYFCPRCRLF